jgi:hypothetical protein
LQQLITKVPFDDASRDAWSLIWGNMIYSFRRYYHMVYGNMEASPTFKKIWSPKCTPSIPPFDIKMSFVVGISPMIVLLKK